MIESDYDVKLEDDGMSMASKKIGKKDKTQVRFKSKKKDDEEFLASVDQKYIPDEFYDPSLSKTERKKLMIKIRNRAAAQTSRNKKKAYMNHLEDAKTKIIVENKQLKEENRKLNQGWNAMEEQISSLRNEVAQLKNQSQTSPSNASEDFTCMHCGKKQVPEVYGTTSATGASSASIHSSSENSTDSYDSSPMESPNLLTRCAPNGARSKKSFYFFMFAFAAIMMGLVTVQYAHSHPSVGGLVPSFEIPKFATNFLLTDSTNEVKDQIADGSKDG